MVRHRYIQNEVLKLYRSLATINYPINPLALFCGLENSRIISYQELASTSGCSLAEITAICESESGCTHYNKAADRYLTLYNSSNAGNNVDGRIRWTVAHELGHVVLEHLPIMAVMQIAENNFNNISDPELEQEADFFAATLLCPFPAYEILGIRSPRDIQDAFGLSEEASRNRMTQYSRWRGSRVKTSWENDMKRLIATSYSRTTLV